MSPAPSRTSGRPGPVLAAGAVLWRVEHGRIEVALIHRPRYDDWSWPKGKLDPGEDFPQACVREVEEETGLRCRLGIPLPASEYLLPRGERKVVRYWAAEVVGGHGRLEHEVDQVEWLPGRQARRRLSHPRDAEQLDAVLEARRRGTLDTWPLVVVRHAHALSRSQWSRDDWLRPLSDSGRRRSHDIAPLLAAYDVQQVISSSAVRCQQTVAPFLEDAGVPLHTKKGLSEEGFDAEPHKVLRHLEKALVRGAPVALCSHRPLLPSLLTALSGRAAAGSAASRALDGAVEGMDKGEVLVCQMSGSGHDATVVAVERHRLPG